MKSMKMFLKLNTASPTFIIIHMYSIEAYAFKDTHRSGWEVITERNSLQWMMMTIKGPSVFKSKKRNKFSRCINFGSTEIMHRWYRAYYIIHYRIIAICLFSITPESVYVSSIWSWLDLVISLISVNGVQFLQGTTAFNITYTSLWKREFRVRVSRISIATSDKNEQSWQSTWECRFVELLECYQSCII